MRGFIFFSIFYLAACTSGWAKEKPMEENNDKDLRVQRKYSTNSRETLDKESVETNVPQSTFQGSSNTVSESKLAKKVVWTSLPTAPKKSLKIGEAFRWIDMGDVSSMQQQKGPPSSLSLKKRRHGQKFSGARSLKTKSLFLSSGGGKKQDSTQISSNTLAEIVPYGYGEASSFDSLLNSEERKRLMEELRKLKRKMAHN